MNVTVLSGQNLLDLAIQTSGDAVSAIALAIANGISVTGTLTIGGELRTAAIANRDITNYYTNKNLKPATALSSEIERSGIFDGTFDNTFE